MLNDFIWYGIYEYSDNVYGAWSSIGLGLYEKEFKYDEPEARIVRMMQSWFSLPIAVLLDVITVPVVLLIFFPGMYIYFIYVFIAAVVESFKE